jgi:myxalamid-type nonribosomal peptide synthetase MxaA
MVHTASWQVDHCLVDAFAATAEGLRRLSALAGDAQILSELRWPAHALPHAVHVHRSGEAASGLGAPRAGAAIHIVDRHLHAAAVDARGRLAISGSTVPTSLLRGGLADRAAWQWGEDGPRLLTDLVAWRTEGGCRAELPHGLAGATWPSPGARRIEAVLGAQSGVAAVGLVERLTPQGEWEHALFHVLQREAPADELAARLRRACVAQGCADVAFVELRSMPRTDKGIDRFALARGELQAAVRVTTVAPRDEIESALHVIWCELLKRERIGVDDDFFDLGGQSLLASVMLYQIEEKLGVALGMDTLLDSPTVAGMARAIRAGGATGGAPCDLAQEALLAADIVPAAPYRPGAVQDIFLTGATGFLGVHLLAELLETTSARVHCLVRADSESSGSERLAGALESHGLWRADRAARIVAVPGELDKPLLGLGAARFDALAREVDAVYHNGAAVNFVYPYRALKQVNVLATEDVLRLACLHKTKPVHYISTVGVLDRGDDVLEESLVVPLHDKLLGGYEQSKWVAERLVGMASERGLPVATYRPSRIVGHSRTGRMNTDDLFSRLIKGIAMQGEAPRDLGFDNMLPVDLASRLIVACSLNPAVHGEAVHVVNPQSNSLDAVVDAIEAQGHPIERLDYTSWLERLAAHAKRDPGHPLASLLPVLRKLNPAADPSLRRRMPFAHENIARWAGPVLAQGLRPVDEWLKVYFDHFDAIGYLARPAQSVAQQLAA